MKKKAKAEKRIQKSIQSQILATALCPLVAMSTAVSILAVNGYDGLLMANVIAAILLIGVIQLVYVARSIVKTVRMAEGYLNQLAEGNLDIVIDKRLGKRDDELGSMSISLNTLKQKLKASMGDIQDVSGKLVGSEENLEQAVGAAELAAKQIQTASEQVASNAERQNADMTDAAANIEEINGLIANIAVSVEHLKDTSGKMQEDGRNSMEIMTELMESNEHTNKVIGRINEQIHLTYEAAVKITAVTEMITAIAKQTGLLALNASIEAARAGEFGRGFSVVAEEISTLANQSSDSAKEINELISDLSIESKKMLEIMDEVLADAKQQKDNLEKTQVHFEKVSEGIEESLHEILEIGKQAEICDTEKDKVTQHIEALKTLTEENVSSTKDTQQMVMDLSNSIKNIDSVADLLRGYADTLNEQLNYFVIDKQ